MKILFLITARAGSKGLPGKNIKKLGDKPLIQYSIDFALENMRFGDELCISTNDEGILGLANGLGIKIPFKRPEELATDISKSYDVIMHAINYYESNNINFDLVLLLQPTSPFREKQDFENLIQCYSDGIEMVVSVKKCKENPYFSIFEENENGFLEKSKSGNFQRRQDCPDVYSYNGSMYLMSVKALKSTQLNSFKKVKKILMPEERSIDIDTISDWDLAEYYLNKK